ncbi:hypothetical protein PCANC_28013 [Puccinia coronata f. sp. avenae]|uniref:Uncharacterized protein n=1 Tax=Puccinia coronata f. sp. avenae TaxID=200324 RepID=A0A2N5S3M5_9BASI|nr:hypothetical protein PCASD_26638 [Puccinia coronata f. sp. avenae]PLW24842.1 hypothetical protein PCANC_28013 [Puccinia coronata f. sp. avenae]PLW33347.1 hypothetical protein PCASD_18002 [Puccinia coronata f. sp. avenae]
MAILACLGLNKIHITYHGDDAELEDDDADDSNNSNNSNDSNGETNADHVNIPDGEEDDRENSAPNSPDHTWRRKLARSTTSKTKKKRAAAKGKQPKNKSRTSQRPPKNQIAGPHTRATTSCTALVGQRSNQAGNREPDTEGQHDNQQGNEAPDTANLPNHSATADGNLEGNNLMAPDLDLEPPSDPLLFSL